MDLATIHERGAVGTLGSSLRVGHLGSTTSWDMDAAVEDGGDARRVPGGRGEASSFTGSSWTLRDAVPAGARAGRVPTHLGGSGGGRPSCVRTPTRGTARRTDCRGSTSCACRRGRRVCRCRTRSPLHRSSVGGDVVASAERRFGSWGGLVTGTPDEFVAALRREVALGVHLFICRVTDFGHLGTIRLFADEVLPALS